MMLVVLPFSWGPQLRTHCLTFILVGCITHGPQSGPTPLRTFQSLHVPLFSQHLDIERAVSPPACAGRAVSLSFSNKEAQPGQARGSLVTAGSRGVLDSVVGNGCLDPSRVSDPS